MTAPFHAGVPTRIGAAPPSPQGGLEQAGQRFKASLGRPTGATLCIEPRSVL